MLPLAQHQSRGGGVGALAHCTHLNQPAYYCFLFYNLTVKRTVMKWNYCDFAIPVSPHSPIFSFRRFSMINVFWSRGKVAMELCDSKEEWRSVCAVYWLKKIGSSTAKKSHEQWQVFIKFDVRFLSDYLIVTEAIKIMKKPHVLHGRCVTFSGIYSKVITYKLTRYQDTKVVTHVLILFLSRNRKLVIGLRRLSWGTLATGTTGIDRMHRLPVHRGKTWSSFILVHPLENATWMWSYLGPMWFPLVIQFLKSEPESAGEISRITVFLLQ